MERYNGSLEEFFPNELFEQFMSEYYESLAHTSLSCEMAFNELHEANGKLIKCLDKKVNDNYALLTEEEKRKVDFQIRFSTAFIAYSLGAFEDNVKMHNPETHEGQQAILEIFNKHLKDCEDYLYRMLVFDENGKFKHIDTHRRILNFFPIYTEIKVLYQNAYDMKKDHITAFEYAMNLDHIGIPEIKEINRLVNEHNPNIEEGFKKVDNMIIGSSNTTARKEQTATRIAELLYNYSRFFGDDVFVYNEEDYENEIEREAAREKVRQQIIKREAMFHILFENIHPFADGNGRTGRIILNRNLIKQGCAPVVISEREKYIKMVEKYDFEGLQSELSSLESQQFTNWISRKRNYEKIDPAQIGSIFWGFEEEPLEGRKLK